jgi:hypothetical protein
LDVDEEAEAERKKKQFKLIKDETQSTGAVSREVYTVYIKAFGGLSILIFAVSIFVAAQLAEIGGPSSHRVSRNRAADLVHVSRGLIGVKSLGITVRFGVIYSCCSIDCNCIYLPIPPFTGVIRQLWERQCRNGLLAESLRGCVRYFFDPLWPKIFRIHISRLKSFEEDL